MSTSGQLIKSFNTSFLLLIAGTLLIFSNVATAQEVIRVGISTSFKPFNFIDERGEISGYNADVARAMCEKMQVTCEFVTMPFPKIIPALERNEIQLAASNLLKTPERQARINFTDKYYRSTTSLVGRAEDSFKDPMALLQQANTRILVTKGSTQWHYLKQHSKAEIIPSNTLKESLVSLSAGHGDYILLPTLFALNYLQQPENSYLDFIGLPVAHPTLEGDVHMGLVKGQPELQKRANRAIRELVDSGELRALIDKYFPFNVY